MEDIISILRNKSVHIVGVTGAEGSSILRFLIKHNLTDITVHDFLKAGTVAKSFRLWHKGLSTVNRENFYLQFQSDLSSVKLNSGKDYLKGIENADIIFVPQSWRLYANDNRSLFNVSGKIPFYSLTRLYLEYAPATIIGVTGTVGKGSTANIIYQLLQKIGKNIYFAGNDTWMMQLADKLDEMTNEDTLILEISHRQLQDGFTRAPHIVVITNIYPNHLDEVDEATYTNLKLSLVKKQNANDIAVLNYDIPKLRLKGELKSKVVYFSDKFPEMNTESIQTIFKEIMSNKSNQYNTNLLAGYTIAELCGLNTKEFMNFLPKFTSLPARLELIKTIGGVNIYNDIKSTTPWATLAAINKLGPNTILICGGKSKGIDYKVFALEISLSLKCVIAINSEMNAKLVNLLPKNFYTQVNNMTQALKMAYRKAQKGDSILISPAAGYFYSDFIRGKESIRKIITSLLPKEQF